MLLFIEIRLDRRCLQLDKEDGARCKYFTIRILKIDDAANSRVFTGTLQILHCKRKRFVEYNNTISLL